MIVTEMDIIRVMSNMESFKEMGGDGAALEFVRSILLMWSKLAHDEENEEVKVGGTD